MITVGINSNGERDFTNIPKLAIDQVVSAAVANPQLRIYLDTVLWNALCDGDVEAEQFVESLASRNAILVLGLRNFYELAKTFRRQTREASERGQRLFFYLKGFVNASVLCVREIDELLAAEMSALNLGHPVNPFISDQDFPLIRKQVGTLASGRFDERTAGFIHQERAFTSEIRRGQKRRLEHNPEAMRYLKSVPPENLGDWLEEMTYSSVGHEDLKGHVLRRFPEATETGAMEYASALLASPTCRIARSMVRASLYYMWRCAYRDSIPEDLLDDMSHVLSSAYCDVYATQEERQTEYARFLLTARTSIAIYDVQHPIDQWIKQLT